MGDLLTGALALAAVVGFIWLAGQIDSWRPENSTLAREVADRLERADPDQLEDVVRGLTMSEFRSYFPGLKPPVEITHRLEAEAYAHTALLWSQPWLFRRRNRALEVLAKIYRDAIAFND